MKWFRIVAMSAAAALLVACAQSPESTVEKFYRAVEKGEITEASGYMSSQVTGMLGKEKLAAVLTEQSQKIAKCGGVDSLKVALTGEGEIRAGTASITFKGDCPPRTEKVELIKQDGNWKIGAGK